MSIQLGIAVLGYVFWNIALVRGKEKYKGLKTIAAIYMYLLFIVCPLAISPSGGYFNIDLFKLGFFRTFSAGCFFSALIWGIYARFWRYDKVTISPVNTVALVYLCFSFVAFILSGNPIRSLAGADEWWTGLLFQAFLVFLLFAISRFGKYADSWLRAVLVAGCVVFLLGILNRFSVDPFGFYHGVDLLGQIRFLSTIGQATWYSSYLCLLYPLGIFLFTAKEKSIDRVLAIIFMVLSSASLVTQNSDSAYVAVFIEFIIITVMYIAQGDKVKSLGLSYMIIAISVICTGFLEKIFSHRFHQIDPLSIWVAQGPLPFALLIFGALLYFAGEGILKKESPKVIALFTLCIILVAGVLAGTFVLIKGNILSGYKNFDSNWGNGRGLIWTRVMEMYRDLPLWRKVLGIGPGMMSAYMEKYTELVLDNAHNEWLTVFIEGGVFGGLSYFLIFILSIARSIRSSFLQKDDSFRLLLIALAASVAGYVGHGMFCYQQFLSTPMVFVLMGLSEMVVFNKDTKM